jgi:SAM-dependent methyltransferase
MSDAVTRHYARSQLLGAILDALKSEGKDVTRLTPLDLAPIDAFHIRGREATVELAQLASLQQGERVLDVGCGLGGSARYLAAEYGCRVVGIDLTDAYVHVAAELAHRVGLERSVAFIQGSALDLPFPDASFDLVWTEHAQMNIADKTAFYGELARVLAPGGRLIFHDVFQGEGGPPHFPVPWADDSSISFLIDVTAARATVEAAGLTIRRWDDLTQRSLDWIAAASQKRTTGPRPRLGLHLLMGNSAAVKSQNNIANLRERRIVVMQACCEKR